MDNDEAVLLAGLLFEATTFPSTIYYIEYYASAATFRDALARMPQDT
jgi:hypothetical protein